MGSPDHMAETAEMLAYAGRILGPQDHFYAAGAHLDELADWPAWRRARLAAAGPLDDGKRPGSPMPAQPRPARPSPPPCATCCPPSSGETARHDRRERRRPR